MKRIVLAGGSGFLGQTLARYFAQAGYEPAILTRAPKSAVTPGRAVYWNARTSGAWQTELEGAEAVINLTGRSVDCRYNGKNRREILESRVESTRAIGQAITACNAPPRIWINASTATIYKHTLGSAWDEAGEIGASDEANDSFSIEVARAWEGEFNSAQTPGTRKVALRAAMVLGSGRNSVLPVLMRLVRTGLGGKHGTGKQFVSWIHGEDFCRAVDFLIGRQDLAGPINVCAPNPLTNEEMMRVLREVAGRGFGLPARRWMLEIGAFFLRTETELMIKSRRVIPKRLLESGFVFQFSFFRAAAIDLREREKHKSPLRNLATDDQRANG
jgi:uncharacterized protein